MQKAIVLTIQTIGRQDRVGLNIVMVPTKMLQERDRNTQQLVL